MNGLRKLPMLTVRVFSGTVMPGCSRKPLEVTICPWLSSWKEPSRL